MKRSLLLEELKTHTFDLLVIGGGATGSGIALDAASRGLSVALVEASDFSSGTSSRSTKLIHGGVRYLELAFKHFDWRQGQLIAEALRERAILLRIAPHLVRTLPIIIPADSLWKQLYYASGMKLYDLLSGKHRIGSSHSVSEKQISETFPEIPFSSLKGGVEYFDAQFDDARMNVSLILTAIEMGACPVNYARLEGLKRSNRDWSACVSDVLSGECFEVKAKACVNAAGPWSDLIRKLDDPKAAQALEFSRGTHLVLPHKYAPSKGLLIPKTADGRVLFVLPWQGATLVGTTDCFSDREEKPIPSEKEIDFLLLQLKTQLNLTILRTEILAAWTGIRPLLSQEGKRSADLVREFKIVRSDSGLYSLMGGKWTIYRKMAEIVVNRICSEVFERKISCRTADIPLVGAKNYSLSLAIEIENSFNLPPSTCRHLVDSYGDRAKDVALFCRQRNEDNPLLEGTPYLKGEIAYAKEKEMAQTLEDALYRRLRMGFLNQQQTDYLFSCSSIFSSEIKGA